MAYALDLPGAQPADTNSTTQQHALGLICKGIDPTYGGGEFIYLQGIGSTVVGSFVNYDANWVTALHTTALDKPRPLAVAMAATVASQYGWYQIAGQAVVVKSNALSLGVGEAFGITAGAAVVVATGSITNGALVAVAASAKTAVTSVRIMINRPHDTSDVS